jgi:uncharacterized protein YyaL (SSP411 family)
MNRLANETSPYLRQHAANPVDWYPWGEEAFRRAREEDRPILLSVGYSSCHWCHVMAHESFEDDETAKLMNELFVNVKVDREERPDVDAVYMEATQALTGRGGWPMTVFLTPDGRPFYAGTYFPPRAQGGLPAFREVCRAVANAWKDQREEVETQANRLVEAIRQSTTGGSPSPRRSRDSDPMQGRDEMVSRLHDWMLSAWDAGWGGFGRAPKFPQATLIDIALTEATRGSRDDRFLAMATTTLAGMASGGIYDHLGGGFARYSTDERWLVPHFEKMLYDQASLVRAYLHGWQATGDLRWLQVVEETVTYVLRDLALEGGGLASAEDADSPDPESGELREGAFYLWSAKEVRERLDSALADEFMDFYNVTWKGNLTGKMHGADGLNILHRPPGAPLKRSAAVEEARRQLLEVRSSRPRPALDGKVLTEWNAMFLSSLAEAAASTGNSEWAHAAVELGEFMFSRLRRPDGRWMRSYQEGSARLEGFAADYAWVVDSFTRLYELTGKASWVDRAVDTAKAMLSLFQDAADGGFFTNGRDVEQLVVSHKEIVDASTPSANSVAARALWRLGVLTGEDSLTQAATATLDFLRVHAEVQPAAHAFAVATIRLVEAGATEVVVAGDHPDLLKVVRQVFYPSLILAWGEPFPSPLWEGRTGTDARAYVCRGYSCSAPTADPTELARQLGA